MKYLQVILFLLGVSNGLSDIISSCDEGWVSHGNSCYKFVDNERNFGKASEHCNEMGAMLVRIEDDDENQFIHDMVNGSAPHWWIGLSDTNTENRHVWEDCPDEHTHYAHWANGEPNNHDSEEEDCVQMLYQTGYWNDVPCSKSLNYICEKYSSDIARCASSGWRFKLCPKGEDLPAPVRDLCVVKRNSKSPCRWEESFWLGNKGDTTTSPNKFSVDEGCRAFFRVYF